MTYLIKQLYDINSQIEYIQGLAHGLGTIARLFANKEGYESFELGNVLSEHISDLSVSVSDLIKAYERNGE